MQREDHGPREDERNEQCGQPRWSDLRRRVGRRGNLERSDRRGRRCLWRSVERHRPLSGQGGAAEGLRGRRRHGSVAGRRAQLEHRGADPEPRRRRHRRRHGQRSTEAPRPVARPEVTDDRATRRAARAGAQLQVSTGDRRVVEQQLRGGARPAGIGRGAEPPDGEPTGPHRRPRRRVRAGDHPDLEPIGFSRAFVGRSFAWRAEAGRGLRPFGGAGLHEGHGGTPSHHPVAQRKVGRRADAVERAAPRPVRGHVGAEPRQGDGQVGHRRVGSGVDDGDGNRPCFGDQTERHGRAGTRSRAPPHLPARRWSGSTRSAARRGSSVHSGHASTSRSDRRPGRPAPVRARGPRCRSSGADRFGARCRGRRRAGRRRRGARATRPTSRFMAVGPDLWRLRRLQTEVVAAGLVLVDSYVSLTEVSEYAKGMPEEHRRPGSTRPCRPRASPPGASTPCPRPRRRRELVHAALRGAQGADARARRLRSQLRRARRAAHHGLHGVDDYEWGVTLFAQHPDDLKEVVYTMRYDRASAHYAEFGPSTWAWSARSTRCWTPSASS